MGGVYNVEDGRVPALAPTATSDTHADQHPALLRQVGVPFAKVVLYVGGRAQNWGDFGPDDQLEAVQAAGLYSAWPSALDEVSLHYP